MHDRFTAQSTRRFGICIGTLVIGTAFVASNSARCSAQQPSSSFGTPASKQLNNPAVSPYLNLTQPGLNPAITYGTLIQPEIQLRATLANQQNLLGDLQQKFQTQPPVLTQQPTLLQTGHTTAFLDTGSFFFPISRNARQGK
jgi:hypothetical protein